MPEKEQSWVQINASRAGDLPTVSAKAAPLSTADARKKALGF